MRNKIIYFSSNMRFQTEIFQGMFSTIIIIDRVSLIFKIFVSYQFCIVPLKTLDTVICNFVKDQSSHQTTKL